jgi:putative ABC transport system permease protein
MIEHLESATNDVRYAVRTLIRTPGYALVAILTLAIGLATTTAMFSVVDTAVLRALPYADPERLLTVYERSEDGGLRVPSYPTFQDWQAQSVTVASAIQGMAFIRGDGVVVPMPNGPERGIAAYVTPGFFALLGTRPMLGRTFAQDEERPGAPHVGILSYDYFVKQFGADPNTIGRVVAIDSVPTTIIGVMPRAFAYPNFADPGNFLPPAVWQPIAVFEASHAALKLRGLHVDSRALLRLRRGVDSAQAATVMKTIALRLATQYPVEQAHWTSIALQPMTNELFGTLRQTIVLISSAIGLVLLLACANVANLSLVRASARARELAVRSALGGGRWRLARQLLTEALVLSLCAVGVGFVMAFALVGYVRRSASAQLPFSEALAIDVRAALFALAAALATAVLVGLLPAIQAGSARLMERLRSGIAAATGGARERRVRNILVAVQFALALTLLVGAGLLIQSFRRIAAVPLGYDARDTIEFAISPPRHRYETPTEAAALYGRILAAVSAVPGVTGAAAKGGALLPVKVETDASSGGRAVESAIYHPVSTAYRRILRIPLVTGRWFSDDDMRSPNGFVVSAKLAKKLWPGEMALGKRVTVRRASQARADFGQPITMPVIGVLADVRENGPEDDLAAEIYLPYTLEVWPWMQFVVRADNPARALAAVDRAIRDVEPALNFFGKPSIATTGADAIDAQRRFVTFVLAGFAGCALLLATLGLYGTVSYSVVQRTRELGVRIALGASRRSIILLVMRSGLAVVLVGAAVGLGGAIAATRIIRSMLFQTTATDIATLIAVPVLLTTAATLASYWSARRAAKTDPMVAMKGE